jgi:hypothetical protein
VRVRQFELRLLAVGLTVLWAVGGGIVLIAYRPGGPVDLLVGVAASLPLLVSVASVVWPPLVRSNRGSAGVFWLGLLAGLLLVPSIAGVAAQVMQGGTEPLLPSFEATYSWAVALLATSLFAGLGISRQVIAEAGIGRRRLSAAVGFAVVATSLIGGTFAGVSGADNAALGNMPAPNSRFAPAVVGPDASGPALSVPANCRSSIASPVTAHLDLDLSANVDSSAVGTVSLSGNRSGSDVSWSAQVVRSDLFGQYSTVRVGSRAWTLSPEGSWQIVNPATVDAQTIDLVVLTNSLRTENRATAEDWGLEYVEGARARHCRVAVDGATFAASFPQVAWLVGTASLQTWRGELDFWVFADNEVGMVAGSVNGDAEAILPHGLLATVRVKMTATERNLPLTISPPRT